MPVDDPVAAARQWLVRHGGVADDEPLAERAGRPEPGPPDGESSPQVEVRARAGRAGTADADADALARAVVTRKLAAQARSRSELSTALAARDVPAEVAEEVLDSFTAIGLVDDAAFARDWVASRQQRRHLSATALRRELRAKGVERDTIDSALGVVDSADEYAAASALAVKKLRSMAGLSHEVRYRRLAAALARRGFNSSISSAVLSSVLNDRADPTED